MDDQLLHEVLKYNDGTLSRLQDELAREEPLEIRVRGRAVSVTMRTPTPGSLSHDEELAAGFLLSEAIIANHRDIEKIAHCDRNDDNNVLNVVLASHVHVDFKKLTRHVFASSSCGLCGKATIDAIHTTFPPVDAGLRVDADTLLAITQQMRDAQSIFDRTGGLHAAALFNTDGELLVLREDIGRHNAVDKVLGHALLHDMLPLDQHVLAVSGRSSFEIMQKALAGRLPIVAAVSAPSDLAVKFAQSNGQTLIGFLRDRRMNIYTHPQRILTESLISNR